MGLLDRRWGGRARVTSEHSSGVMSKVISIGSAVTQTSSAVVSLLKYLGKPIDPLPQTVDLPGMVLVLSNKRDVYYTTSENSCSCPSAAYRPGQRCKHQRKHFPQADKPVPMAPVESLQPAGKWAGGFNGPVDPRKHQGKGKQRDGGLRAMPSDIYSQVNDRIIAALEQGIIPWKRPWAGRLPTNYDSGKQYRGINILTLGIAEMVHGYSSPYWITFRQAQKHGGHIKRGEKATYIVFSDKKVREVEKEDGTKELKVYHFIKSFPVFNWDQTEGVPKKEAGLALDPDRDLIDVCDSILNEMPNPPAYRERRQLCLLRARGGSRKPAPCRDFQDNRRVCGHQTPRIRPQYGPQVKVEPPGCHGSCGFWQRRLRLRRACGGADFCIPLCHQWDRQHA